jgi:hypothetical protein
MKRRGPLNGSGPGAEKLRVLKQHSRTLSEHGRASLPSHPSASQSRATAPGALLADSTALLIVLKAKGRSRFDALFGETRLVKASANPISDAARVLHRQGHHDDRLLVVRHEGADHYSLRGRLGVWRRLRVREDRGRLRFARWEPFPSRPVRARKGRTKAKAGHRAGEKNAPATPPGAARRQCRAAVPSTVGLFDPEVSDA